MKLNKKIGLLLISISIGTVSLVASPQNQATLTDIKESLYYLIKDYKKLDNKFDVKSIEINKNKKNIQTNEEKIKILESKIKTLKDKLKKLSIKTNNLSVVTPNDKYSKRISAFVEQEEKKDKD